MGKQNSQHKMTVKAAGGINTILSSAGGDVGTTLSLDPSNMDEFSDYAALFDEMRIKSIEVQIFMARTQGNGVVWIAPQPEEEASPNSNTIQERLVKGKLFALNANSIQKTIKIPLGNPQWQDTGDSANQEPDNALNDYELGFYGAGWDATQTILFAVPIFTMEFRRR